MKEMLACVQLPDDIVHLVVTETNQTTLSDRNADMLCLLQRRRDKPTSVFPQLEDAGRRGDIFTTSDWWPCRAQEGRQQKHVFIGGILQHD